MGNLCANLDEQIEQLLQCKPLVEPEVPLVSPPPGCFDSWVLDLRVSWAGQGGFGWMCGRQGGCIGCLPSLN